jgi:hypothetical protein
VLKKIKKNKTLELLVMPRRTLGTITGMSFVATPGLFEMLELESH